MNKVYFKYSFLLFSSALLLFACSDSYFMSDNGYSTVKSYLAPSKNTIDLGSEKGATQVFEVFSNANSWKFEGLAPWLVLSPKTGDADATVEITANEDNPSADETRSCLLILKEVNGSLNSSIVINQKESSPSIKLIHDGSLISEVILGAAEGSAKSINVSSNAQWEATKNNPDTDGWLHLDTSSKNAINISADENTTGENRVAQITVKFKKSKGDFKTLTITQTKAIPSLTQTELKLGNKKETKTINITIPSKCYINAPDSWLSVDHEICKAGTTELHITAEANTSTSARIGFVYVTQDNQILNTIIVTQQGMALNIELDKKEFSSKATNNAKLTVKSNVDWKIECNAGWIRFNKNKGSNNDIVGVDVEPNNTIYPRVGTIRVIGMIDAKNIYEQSVTISQPNESAGSVLYPYLSTLLPCGQSIKVNVGNEFNTGTTWLAKRESGIDWFDISSPSGNSKTPLVITAKDNPSGNPRSSYILLTVEDIVYQVVVAQYGKSISFDSDSIVVSAKGGTSETVEVIVDDHELIDKIITSKEGNWFDVSRNGSLISVHSQENYNGEDRSGYIEVSLDGVDDLKKRLVVHQNSKYISIEDYSADEDWNNAQSRERK